MRDPRYTFPAGFLELREGNDVLVLVHLLWIGPVRTMAPHAKVIGWRPGAVGLLFSFIHETCSTTLGIYEYVGQAGFPLRDQDERELSGKTVQPFF